MRGFKALCRCFLVVFVVSFSSIQLISQNSNSFRRTKEVAIQTEPLASIPASIMPVVDTLDGVVRVGIYVPHLVLTPKASSALAAFIRSLANNQDIEIASIDGYMPPAQLADMLQSGNLANNNLGPWRGMSVTAGENEVVIQGNGSQIRIPVYMSEDMPTDRVDVAIVFGSPSALGTFTSSDANQIYNASRTLLVPVGLGGLLDSTESSATAVLPNEVSDDQIVQLNASEITALGVALKALEGKFGGAFVSRVDLLVPQGDLEIKPQKSRYSLEGYLGSLGLNGGQAQLNVTELSGALRGARRLETVLTLPGKVTKEDLIQLFQETPNLSVAAEDASASAMYNNPYDTSVFTLDKKKTEATQIGDYTLVKLCGWVGDYSMAGMMISTITEMGRQLSELGQLTTQDTPAVFPNVEYAKPQVLAQPRTVMVNGAAGRIGLNTLRTLIGNPNFQVVAVNGVNSAEALRLGFMYDEVLGPTSATVTTGVENISIPILAKNYYVVVNGEKTKVAGENEAKHLIDILTQQLPAGTRISSVVETDVTPKTEEKAIEYIEINGGRRIYLFNYRTEESIRYELPLVCKALGIEAQYLLETTGKGTSAAALKPYFDAGIGLQRVFISAPAKDKKDTPAKDKILQVVPGVNQDALVAKAQAGALPQIISAGSCTTNNSAPAVKAMVDILNEAGVNVSFLDLETIHAVTKTQAHLLPIQVDKLDEPERARAGGLNIIPTKTGAEKVLPAIIEGIGKISGSALRVGNPNGSLSRLIFYLDKACPLSAEEIVTKLKEQAATNLLNVLTVNEGAPLNSLAINGADVTSIIEASSVQIVPVYDPATGTKVCDAVVLDTWYDNEWGFTQQYIRLVTMMGLLEENPGLTADELFQNSDLLGEHAYVPGQ